VESSRLSGPAALQIMPESRDIRRNELSEKEPGFVQKS